MKLKDWINQQTVKKVAELMSVDKSAVRHWRRGHCLPKPEQMLKIKVLSRGKVNIDDTITAYFAGRSAK